MSVLFVCTGNIFRSFTAELCLKNYLKKRDIKFRVSSAGTRANPRLVKPYTFRALYGLGIKVPLHVPQKLTKELASTFNNIIAMAQPHQSFIKKNFGLDVPLFNEVCYDINSSILDDHEVHVSEEVHANKTIKYIYNAIPLLANKIGLK